MEVLGAGGGCLNSIDANGIKVGCELTLVCFIQNDTAILVIVSGRSRA
ncbi:hypothetical protein DSUL_20095 [Desulfovibrionales bacterium]